MKKVAILLLVTVLSITYSCSNSKAESDSHTEAEIEYTSRNGYMVKYIGNQTYIVEAPDGTITAIATH